MCWINKKRKEKKIMREKWALNELSAQAKIDFVVVYEGNYTEESISLFLALKERRERIFLIQDAMNSNILLLPLNR